MHWHGGMVSDLSVTAVQAKCSGGLLKKDVWQHMHNIWPNPKKGLVKIWDCNYCGAGDLAHGKDMSSGPNIILEHFSFSGERYIFHSYVVRFPTAC